jgi:hypothetical protein
MQEIDFQAFRVDNYKWKQQNTLVLSAIKALKAQEALLCTSQKYARLLQLLLLHAVIVKKVMPPNKVCKDTEILNTRKHSQSKPFDESSEKR